MVTSRTGFSVKRWLFENDRIDVIQELQHAFPSVKGGEYLLWSDFETALGQYDIDTVLNWGWEDLYITSTSIGNLKFDNPCALLNFQLPDIIRDVFPVWVKSIPIATIPAYKLPSQALYLSFNYTDTIERLYQIQEWQILFYQMYVLYYKYFGARKVALLYPSSGNKDSIRKGTFSEDSDGS